MPYVAVPTEPGPPAYDEIESGEELDLRDAVRAYERLSPAERADGRIDALWQSIGAWIAAHNAHCWAGFDLCHDLAIAVGVVPDEGGLSDSPTDKIEQISFRPRWVPDVEADTAAQGAEMMAALDMLRRRLDQREFVDLLSHGGKVMDVAELIPPLTLEDAEVADVEDGDDASGWSPGAVFMQAGERDEVAIAVAAPLDGVAHRPRHQRWLAGGMVIALAAVAAVAVLTTEPAATLRPLPMSSYDGMYPGVGDEFAPATAAGLPAGSLAAVEAPTEFAGASRQAREARAPRSRPRVLRTIRLTEPEGVVIRQKGKRDLLITARETEEAPPGAAVIHAEDFFGAPQLHELGDFSIVIER